MTHEIEITAILADDYSDLSLMVGELLNEIMEKIDSRVFRFNRAETEERARDLVSRNKYWVFIARDKKHGANIGFVSLYESYALYSEGAFGTIPELYVRPAWRSKSLGKRLLDKVLEFASDQGWKRVEVTTPPLPQFDRTLRFYQANGFDISGGRKLKIDVERSSQGSPVA